MAVRFWQARPIRQLSLAVHKGCSVARSSGLAQARRRGLILPNKGTSLGARLDFLIFECFSFENSHSKLKLWALKDGYQNQRNSKGTRYKTKQKFVNFALSKVLDLNTPCDRAS